jgi:glycosyltransferase involved in cell wall biosynthesis
VTNVAARFACFLSPALRLPAAWEFPEFEVREYSPRTSRNCVVVPVINEGAKFLRQLDGMRELGFGADVIVADGGSTDGTTQDSLLQERGVTALLVKRGPGRLSAQLRMAFAYALARGYEGVVIIDGNGKDGFQAIPAFLRALDEGFGFVQGSRYVEGGIAINTPLDRHVAVRCVHAPLISVAAGFRYTDTTNGFRAFSAGFLRDDRVAVFRDIFDTYNLHYYLAIRAPRLGYRVVELPVRREYPARGKTPTKIAGWRGRLLILRQLWTAVTGGYDPKRGDVP